VIEIKKIVRLLETSSFTFFFWINAIRDIMQPLDRLLTQKCHERYQQVFDQIVMESSSLPIQVRHKLGLRILT
jgi:hypothetical protein